MWGTVALLPGCAGVGAAGAGAVGQCNLFWVADPASFVPVAW